MNMNTKPSLHQAICGEIGWVGFDCVGFLVVCLLHKINPNPRKLFAVGKSGPNATFLIFLGVGWPWVGEFVGFMIILTRLPTQHNLVNCKHPIAVQNGRYQVLKAETPNGPYISVQKGRRHTGVAHPYRILETQHILPAIGTFEDMFYLCEPQRKKKIIHIN